VDGSEEPGTASLPPLGSDSVLLGDQHRHRESQSSMALEAMSKLSDLPQSLPVLSESELPIPLPSSLPVNVRTKSVASPVACQHRQGSNSSRGHGANKSAERPTPESQEVS
jgi:hypothetical protein